MPPQPRFELFAYWRTSATYRVRVAMNLKNIAPDKGYINPVMPAPPRHARAGGHPRLPFPVMAMPTSSFPKPVCRLKLLIGFLQRIGYPAAQI